MKRKQADGSERGESRRRREDGEERDGTREGDLNAPLISAILYLSPTNHSPLPAFNPSSRTE
jgi:hypothetical protein